MLTSSVWFSNTQLRKMYSKCKLKGILYLSDSLARCSSNIAGWRYFESSLRMERIYNIWKMTLVLIVRFMVTGIVVNKNFLRPIPVTMDAGGDQTCQTN